MRRRLPGLALLVAAVLSACGGDSTAPRPSIDVAVALSSTLGPSSNTDAQGNPLISCQLQLAATASGEGSAAWLDGMFRVFVGKNRKTPVDSFAIEASDIQQAWSGSTIKPGDTQHSVWNVSANIPFGGELEFRYRPNATNDTKRAKVSFTCGPTIAPDAAPPVVASITMTPPSGELPAGAPLNVTYSASAQAGLWQTVVRVTGPCIVEKRFAEQLQTTVTHQLSIPMPGDCQLGIPITVVVAVVDAAAQVASKTQTSTLVIADHEPPTILPLYFPPGGGSARTTAGGDYFGGDSIQLIPNAGDNHAVAAIIWEVLPYGTKDSVVVTPAGVPWSIFVRLRPEWNGPIQLRLYARDAVGLTSDTATTPRDSLRVHPLVERPTRTATVTGETRDIVIDSRRGLVYLRQGNDHRIAVFSMATMQLTSTLALGAVPLDFDLTPSGDSLIVVIYGQSGLGVVDVRQSTLALSTLPLTGLDAASSQMPAAVRVGSNGKAYVMLGGSTAASRTLLEVDLATGAQRARPEAGLNGRVGAGGMSRSLDQSVLMIDGEDPRCLQRFDVAANAFSACVQPDGFIGVPTVDATGQRFAVGLDVYDSSFQLFPKTAPALTFGVPITVLSADGNVLFVSLWNYGIVRLQASDSKILDRTPNTTKPTGVRLAPDGSALVSIESNYGATTKISVIDLR